MHFLNVSIQLQGPAVHSHKIMCNIKRTRKLSPFKIHLIKAIISYCVKVEIKLMSVIPNITRDCMLEILQLRQFNRSQFQIKFQFNTSTSHTYNHKYVVVFF